MFRTMIVDDEYDIREGLKTLIDWESHGFEIVGQACDGVEALELYEEQKPAFVITDIMMPGMDGIELSRELKMRNPNMKILILSGYNDFTYAKEAMKYGVNSYLLKPVDKTELCSELERIYDILLSEYLKEKNENEKNGYLKDLFLMKLVKGELFTDSEKDKLESYFDLNCENFCTLIIEVKGNRTYCPVAKASDILHQKLAIRHIIEEILRNDSMGYVFEISGEQFGILLTGKKSVLNPEIISGIISNIDEVLRKYAGLHVLIGEGEIVKSVEEIKNSFLKAIKSLEVCNLIESRGESESDRNLDAVLKYIYSNYSNEINLKKLSEVFFMNPVYLGQLFKKYTGEYFNDFINSIRIENAKKLLEESHLKIHEISEKVGYKNIEHFYKIFKTKTGYKPGEFVNKVCKRI